jgi:hypothetical protein
MTLEKKSETRTFRYSFSERKTGLPDTRDKLLVPKNFLLILFERKTGLEPATPTLARSCSTN